MPIVPAVSVEVVIARGTAFTVNVNCRDAVCAEPSLTWAVNVDAPAPVGVPVMAPAADRVRPAGKVPAVTDQVYGAKPPVGARVVA